MDIMKLMPTTTRQDLVADVFSNGQPLQNHWISYTKGPRLKILKSNPLTNSRHTSQSHMRFRCGALPVKVNLIN